MSKSSSPEADIVISFCDLSVCGRPKQRQLQAELFQLEGRVVWKIINSLNNST
jgi:hypothetical protein